MKGRIDKRKPDGRRDVRTLPYVPDDEGDEPYLRKVRRAGGFPQYEAQVTSLAAIFEPKFPKLPAGRSPPSSLSGRTWGTTNATPQPPRRAPTQTVHRSATLQFAMMTLLDGPLAFER